MKALSTKKLALAGMLCALAVVGSVFSFPIFGSKCAPVQHMVNILCAVLLGPYYGIGVAFVASLLRNLLGLGSLMAFPGSMFGALLCGIVYHKTEKLLPTLVGEVFGTSILGGLCAYPVAIRHDGRRPGRQHNVGAVVGADEIRDAVDEGRGFPHPVEKSSKRCHGALLSSGWSAWSAERRSAAARPAAHLQ